MANDPQGDYARFHSTAWGLVANARTDRAALEELVRSYRPALIGYLRRRFSSLPDEQREDFLQEFLLHTHGLEDMARRADQTRGRFRALLSRALDNFVLDRLRRRHLDTRPMPENSEAVAPASEDEAAEWFDASWAESLMRQSVQELFRDCQQDPERVRVWNVFRARYLEVEPLTGVAIGERFGLTRHQVDSAARTGREWVRKWLTDQLGKQTASPAEREESLRELFEVVYRHDRVGHWRMTDSPYITAEDHEESMTRSRPPPGESILRAETLLRGSFVEERLTRLLGTYLAPRTLTLRELLAQPVPPLDQLGRLKEVAKRAEHAPGAVNAGSEGEAVVTRAAWRWVYYAVLAAALARHGQRITSLSDEDLARGFTWLLNQGCGDSDFGEVWEQALARIGRLGSS